MISKSIHDILESYRDAARTQRDKGTYFERLSIAYLSNDPVQIEQYEDVKTFGEWAAENGWSGSDTGIDLVAKLKNEDGFAAIQCKFYDANYRIQKKDIDSFISASGKEPFRRRVVMDSTEKPLRVAPLPLRALAPEPPPASFRHQRQRLRRIGTQNPPPTCG